MRRVGGMVSHMCADRVAALDDPQLRAFAPLVYVAWSDYDLDPDERARVFSRISEQPWLRPAAKLVIDAWTDPATAPSAEELGRLRTLIDRVASTASTRAKESFARVAQSIAADGEARAVADELAASLGLVAGAAAPATSVSVDPDLIGDAVTEASDPALIAALQVALDGAHGEERAAVRKFLGTARRAYGLPIAEQRDHVRRWLIELAATGLGALAFPAVTSTKDLAAFSAVFEELGHGDLSLLVKVGVQWGLFGGAIWALGTTRHHTRLAAIAACEQMGCFAMSEVGHGSNVASLETTVPAAAPTHTPGG